MAKCILYNRLVRHCKCIYLVVCCTEQLRWSTGSVPKFAGSNPAEAVGFLGRKNPQHTSFRGEVKPSVPCRRLTACKRSLNLRGSRNLGKIITGHLSRPQFHLSLLGSPASLRMQRHVAAKAGMSKGGGKQQQTTPRTCLGCSVPRAISVP